jgi:Integrase core domain
MGLHASGAGLGARSVDGLDRRLLRQRRHRIVLGPDAGRATQPAAVNTRVELANAIFDYLEIFHNRKRRHSALGMRTPIEFEKMHTYPIAVALIPASRLHGSGGYIKVFIEPRALQFS